MPARDPESSRRSPGAFARAGCWPAGPRRRAALRRARLGLPARPRGASRGRRARARAARPPRPARRRGRRRRRALRAPGASCSASQLDVVRLTPPGADAGNLQAWARDARYAAGARAAAAHGARLAAGHTLTDQAETILYRLAASPGRRALLGMRDERGLLVRPLLRARVTREDTAAWCRARGLPVARGRLELRRALRALARSRSARAGARGRSSGGASRTSRARPSCCATRPRCSTRWSTRALDGGDRIALGDLAALPPALARLVVRRLAEDGDGRALRRAPPRALGDVLALGEAGALDVGDGARAVVAAGVLRFERTPPLRPSRDVHLDCSAHEHAPDRRDPRPARPAQGARAGARAADRRGLRGARPAARRRAEGRDVLPRRPDAPDPRAPARSTSWPSPRTARRPTPAASCGSSRTSTPRSRAAHVLIVEDIVDSGLTLQYLLRNLGARDPASLEVCALLTKPERRKAEVPIKYTGFEIPNRFAIGYGLDHAERWRNLPYVAAARQHVA